MVIAYKNCVDCGDPTRYTCSEVMKNSMTLGMLSIYHEDCDIAVHFSCPTFDEHKVMAFNERENRAASRSQAKYI